MKPGGKFNKRSIPAPESPLRRLCELITGVFEPEHEEQEKDANFCSKLDKAFGKVQRRDAAIPKCQSREEKEGDCGQPPAPGQAGEHGQADGNTA
jgi:hypothetical protein